MFQINRIDVDTTICETVDIYKAVKEHCVSEGIDDLEEIHVIFNNLLNTLRGESMRKQRYDGPVKASY